MYYKSYLFIVILLLCLFPCSWFFIFPLHFPSSCSFCTNKNSSAR